MAAAVLPHTQMGTCTAALLIPISCKARTGSNYNDTFNKLLLYTVQYTLLHINASHLLPYCTERMLYLSAYSAALATPLVSSQQLINLANKCKLCHVLSDFFPTKPSLTVVLKEISNTLLTPLFFPLVTL